MTVIKINMGGAGALAKKLVNELLDPAADLVADGPDDVDSLTGRVIEVQSASAYLGSRRTRRRNPW
jgi:hypothetical protein